jgi:hypothetical protein
MRPRDRTRKPVLRGNCKAQLCELLSEILIFPRHVSVPFVKILILRRQLFDLLLLILSFPRHVSDLPLKIQDAQHHRLLSQDLDAQDRDIPGQCPVCTGQTPPSSRGSIQPQNSLRQVLVFSLPKYPSVTVSG